MWSLYAEAVDKRPIVLLISVVFSGGFSTSALLIFCVLASALDDTLVFVYGRKVVCLILDIRNNLHLLA